MSESEKQVALFVRSVSSSTFKVLFMMCFMPAGTGPRDLAMNTGLSERTVQKGLEELEFYGAAQRHGRVNGWALTSQARQMLMSMQNDAGERKSFPLACSSSSLSISVSDDSISVSETTSPDEAQNVPLEPDQDAEEAVALLMETGCPERTAKGTGARDSVEAALEGGWTGAETYDAVIGWFNFADYCPREKWIAHKGFLTGARIARLEAPPEEDAESRTRRYMAEALG